MTTAETTRQKMVYSHTIGLSTMEGRGFYYPVDTVCASDGRLYTISRSLEGDTRGVRVTIYDIDSEYYGTFSEFGEGAGQFIWPVAITQNSQGHIYISDEDKNVVTGFDTSGTIVNHWGESGSAPGQLDGPAGLAFDADDRLYVADQHNNRVQVFTPEGELVSSFGSQGSGEVQFGLPWGLTVGPDGCLYVADWQNDRVQKLTIEGEYITSFGSSGRGDGQLFRPSGVAVDPEGYVYVSDWGNERVVIFDSDGGLVQNIRGEATDSKWAEAFLSINLEEAAARERANMEPEIDFFNDDPHEVSSHIEKFFWAPTAIKLDDEGRMYVTESNRHRIQIYRRNGD